MNAQKLASFIICFVLAAGVVNSTGIFSFDINAPDMNTEQFDDGMVNELYNFDDTGSEGDLSGMFEGWGLISGTIGLIKSLFSGILIAGDYLESLGVNSEFAAAIGIVAIISLIWGLIQFITNRSGKGMD